MVPEEDNEESKVDNNYKQIDVKYVETPKSQMVINLESKKEKIDEKFSEEQSIPDENDEDEKFSTDSDEEVPDEYVSELVSSRNYKS